MAKNIYSKRLPELWGGIECSYNRVRENYFDQLSSAKHYDRIERDIAAVADLGISTMRYPVVWEPLQPTKDATVDWSTVEYPLALLKQSNINPIVGLVHHGSGPRWASIETDAFATGLQQFAATVAEKFPWVNHYTPVNEPLTTARFCGLYGLWFPHSRDDRSFVQILLNEIKAVVLAMREIRKVNPDAKLVQTEDLAKIYSTPKMRYQADFENHRRWLTFDILCGKLTPAHPLWEYFRRHVKDERDLHFFIDNPCPPDIIGLDYYATSERYLDENTEAYPIHTHGSNGIHRYADVEAIRIRLTEASGPSILLQEVWDRYGLPMAITECHIQCDYENQIRWFGQIRKACIDLLKHGVDIRAITSWAMLGAFGWDKLLTFEGGSYESGAFDISSGSLLRTPIGDYIKQLSLDPSFHHPALDHPGWWQEENRFLFEKNLGSQKEEIVADESCGGR